MNNNPNVMFVQKRMKPIKVGSWSEYGEQERTISQVLNIIAIKKVI